MEKSIAGCLVVVLGLGVVVGSSLLLAFPAMWLWNWLMPHLFGLITIDFWEALGINMLTGILFKSTNINSSK